MQAFLLTLLMLIIKNTSHGLPPAILRSPHKLLRKLLLKLPHWNKQKPLRLWNPLMLQASGVSGNTLHLNLMLLRF